MRFKKQLFARPENLGFRGGFLLYKTPVFADIIIVIIGTLIAVFILTFPLFCSVYGAVYLKQKKAKIAVALFGIVVFKYNARLSFSSLLKSFGGNNPLTKIPKISVLSVKSIINTGIKDDVFLPVMAISAFATAKNTIFNVLHENKPYLKLNCDVNVYNGESILDIFLRVKAVFNLVDVVKYLFQILSEKLRNVIRKKQQNK